MRNYNLGNDYAAQMKFEKESENVEGNTVRSEGFAKPENEAGKSEAKSEKQEKAQKKKGKAKGK